MSYIYLIRNDNEDTYKIGVTKNDPKKRLKQLQTGSSSPLTLINFFQTQYPYRLETMLHNYFKLNNYNGEWYILNNNQVNDFLNICDKFQQHIIILLDNPFFSKNLK